MYSIERKSSGYLLTFSGLIPKEEMQKWFNESKMALSKEAASSFGVIVDMRKLAPLPPDAQALMVDGQGMYKNKGMKRSAVILDSTVTTMQFKRLAQQSGIYQWERYIDASKNPKWSNAAVAWVNSGIDPDKN